MLRLSSLLPVLPIIEISPVQEHEPGKHDQRQAVDGKPVARTGRQATPESGLARLLESGANAALINKASTRLATGSPAAGKTDNVESGLPSTRSGREVTTRSVKSASYGIVSLLNPVLDEAAAPIASHEVHISPTAALLSSLKAPGPQPDHPGPVQRAVPLIHGPPHQPKILAEALKEAIGQSGLFYESHLEQWLNGARTLEALKQEPQGTLPPGLAFSPVEAGAGEPAPHASPHEAAAWLQQNLVQQLSILNNPTLNWSGQVWPGQQMTVQTERDPRHAAQDEARWVTHLSLDMPELGKIDIVIALNGQEVDLDIRSDHHHALNRMQGQQATLGKSLAETGCNLKRMNLGRTHEQS